MCSGINQQHSIDKLEGFFYPRSIAVIGASNTKGKLGYNVFYNLVNHNYEGKLYPVHPKDDYVQGLKAYKNVGEIEDNVDAAIIIVPAAKNPEVIKQCCDKGIKYIINEAAGFAEIGNEGKAIEQEIKQIIKESGCRMIGPNCSGLINTHNNMVQSLGIVGDLDKGNIGIIAQAGAYASGLLWGFRQVLKFGIIATVGNKLDINETDILEAMGADDNISVISMYLEDVRAGNRFISVAREVARKKPIIAFKGGRTDAGRKTAASHTASIAGNAAIYETVFNQTGIVKADDYRDMFDILTAFSMQPLPEGPGVMIISYTGAMGVTSTDACYEKGLRLAELSPESLDKLAKIIPPYVTAKNPADLTFDQTPQQVVDIINTCSADEDVSSFVIVLQAELADQYVEHLKDINSHGKPVIISIPAVSFAMNAAIKMEQLGFPVYDGPETGVRVIAKMYSYQTQQKKALAGAIA